METLRSTAGITVSDRPTPARSRQRRSGVRSSIVNAVLYQVGWFGCVLAAAAGRPWWAIAAALATAGAHSALAPDSRRELQLILSAGALGFLVDSLTVRFGILSFAAPMGPEGMAPLWIVAMWMQFGMTFHFCFGWLARRYVLAAVLGAIGGPLSFLAGARLGAVEVMAPAATNLVLLGLFWAIALPTLVAVADVLAPRGTLRGRYRFESEAETKTS